MFSDDLKRVRKEKNITQKQMASFLGISRSHLSELESGKNHPSSSLATLFNLAFGDNSQYNEIMSNGIADDSTKSWLLNGVADGSMKYSLLHGIQHLYAHQLSDEDRENAWMTATGYIVKYVMLAKTLSMSGDLDDNFPEIVKDDRIVMLLNYVITEVLNDKENGSSLEFIHKMEDAFPDFREYCLRYYTERMKEVQHLQLHQPTIWKEAEELGRFLNNENPPYVIGNYMRLEDKLLAHRIFDAPDSPEDEEENEAE